jgi:hypothetical protein
VIARIQGTGPIHTQTADARGRFRLELPAGIYVLQSSLSSFDNHRLSGVVVRAGETTAVVLSPSIGVTCECIVSWPVKFSTPTPPPATLRGQATDPKGNPIPFAEISLLGGGYFDEYLTGVKGQFRRDRAFQSELHDQSRISGLQGSDCRPSSESS